MTLRYYFDQHMPRSIARGLRRRQIDVLTTQDEGTEEWPDDHLFARAIELGRVMVTEDPDFLVIANRWLAEGRHFPGLIKFTDTGNIGRAIEDLELVATCYPAEEMADRIVYVPL
jgi:predicted nuclease of predicted toxin-antitoxin system